MEKTLYKTTIRLKSASKSLRQAGIDTPQLDAEVLLAHALGCERYELFTSDIVVRDSCIEKFKNYIERRKKREPVAYIVGYKEFWSIKIKVTPAVLIPRPETEGIIEQALKLQSTIHDPRSTILDLCTGSSCIAAAIAKERPGVEITVSDISKEALDVARQNLAFAKDRVVFIQSDLFKNIKGKFDLIVSNPPYIPTQALKTLAPEITRYEPLLALDGGSDGLDFLRKIRQDAPHYLKANGWLILENGPEINCQRSAVS